MNNIILLKLIKKIFAYNLLEFSKKTGFSVSYLARLLQDGKYAEDVPYSTLVKIFNRLELPIFIINILTADIPQTLPDPLKNSLEEVKLRTKEFLGKLVADKILNDL